MVIGVGKFAEKRAMSAIGENDGGPTFGTVLHPSPASPMANRGWQPQAVKQLKALGALD
jgi:single-strand selective monofunctional uracil DNA glycosylase